MVSALSYLDLHARTLPPEKNPSQDYSRELGNDPEHMMKKLDKRIAGFLTKALEWPARLLPSGYRIPWTRAAHADVTEIGRHPESRTVLAIRMARRLRTVMHAAIGQALPVRNRNCSMKLRKAVDDLTPESLQDEGSGGIQ